MVIDLPKDFDEFKLPSDFVEKYATKDPGWGPVGEITYKRTYAHPGEAWHDTCRRVIEGMYSYQKLHCIKHEIDWDYYKALKSAKEAYDRMYHMKWLPAGRGLRYCGTDAVYKKGGAVLNSCAFVTTKNIKYDFAGPFCRLMDLSMLGVGVGFDTLGANTVKVFGPTIANSRVLVIQDEREGWVAGVRAFFEAIARKRPSFPGYIDLSLIRLKGSKLNTMGGVASGSMPLATLFVDLFKLLFGIAYELEIVNGTTPNDPVGVKIVKVAPAEPQLVDSEIITDIANFIGKCIVSGGVRRSAEIGLGEIDDEKFLTLKADKKALLDRRWASNNSILFRNKEDKSRRDVYERVQEIAKQDGDIGIVWLDNCKNYGRMGTDPDYKDILVAGVNPCAEQSLEPNEVCCLVETFPARHEDASDYHRTLKFAYLYAKAVTLVPIHDPVINAVVVKNRRIGTSQSGIQQAIAKFGAAPYFNDFCDTGYHEIRHWDDVYAKWLRVAKSIKVTSVKPSGTVSLLPGATPGIHAEEAAFYIRRIRFADTSPLLEQLEKAGYEIEDDVYAKNTKVVSFPVRAENMYKAKKDLTIWEQVTLAANMQKWWADNNVSITVTFKEEEADQIADVIDLFGNSLKAISFLKLNDHSFEQAPYEAITEERYIEMAKALKTNDIEYVVSRELEDKFCDGMACMLNKG